MKPEVGPENIFSAKNRTPPFNVKTHKKISKILNLTARNLATNEVKSGNERKILASRPEVFLIFRNFPKSDFDRIWQNLHFENVYFYPKGHVLRLIGQKYKNKIPI